MQPTLGTNETAYIIYKYLLAPGVTELSLPEGSTILHTEAQYGIPTLWVMQPLPSIGEAERRETRYFEFYGTGSIIPSSAGELKYIGTTLVSDALVFHVFERVSLYF